MVKIMEESAKEYLEKHRQTEILFTKEIIRICHIVPKNIILKSGAYHFPVVLNIVSLSKATVVTQLNSMLKEVLLKNNNRVALRFFIEDAGRERAVCKKFFVEGTVGGIASYPDDESFNLVEIVFDEEIPEEFTQMMIPLIDAIAGSKKRKDERLFLRSYEMALLKIDAEGCFVIINNNEEKRCYIRDISNSGASFIIYGDEVLEKETPTTLIIAVKKYNSNFILTGKVVRSERLAHRHKLIAVSVQYDIDKVPLSYKVFINNAFRMVKEARSVVYSQKKTGIECRKQRTANL
jgi:hypothetical protein